GPQLLEDAVAAELLRQLLLRGHGNLFDARCGLDVSSLIGDHRPSRTFFGTSHSRKLSEVQAPLVFLASVLAVYQQRHNLAVVGCSLDVLTGMRLCRRPGQQGSVEG